MGQTDLRSAEDQHLSVKHFGLGGIRSAEAQKLSVKDFELGNFYLKSTFPTHL